MKYCKCEILVHWDFYQLDLLGLQLHTEHPKTLLETAQRQNVSRGLTNITDELYKFFIDLCENCLASLVDKKNWIFWCLYLNFAKQNPPTYLTFPKLAVVTVLLWESLSATGYFAKISMYKDLTFTIFHPKN
jgi:hypothetical protein